MFNDEVTPPLATPDKNIRGQEGGDGGAKYGCGKKWIPASAGMTDLKQLWKSV